LEDEKEMNMNVGRIENGKSILFIFTPKPIFDHHKRPLVYDFSLPFVESVVDKLVERPTMNGVNSLIREPTILSGVKPSYTGFDIKTSRYSDNWSFVLIVDSNNGTIRLPHRVIYYGLFLEEPLLNRYSATPEQFVNKQCVMVITRKVYINTSPTQMRNRPNHTVMDDVVIVNYEDAIWNDPSDQRIYENYYTLKPSDSAKS
jgi:hypothetical protein